MEIAEALRRADSNQFRVLHRYAAATKNPGAFLNSGENCLRLPAAAIQKGERQPQVMRAWYYAVFDRNFPPL